MTPETTVTALKQQIRERRPWDTCTRNPTVVEIVAGDRLLTNDEKVAEAGLAADAVVSVLFKTNSVRCSSRATLAIQVHC